jgi:hypothetical protein
MILDKLEEALAEIPGQRLALDEVEADLRSMIAKLRGMPNTISLKFSSPGSGAGTSFVAPLKLDAGQKDRIEEIADILRSNGQALHITTIAERLSKLRNAKILRTDIEPGLNRHIAKTKRPKVTKFGPSIYGLPEWKTQNQPTLTHIAS